MNATKPSKIVGITNSLRSGSYNRMTMEVAGKLMEPSMQMKPLDINDIPFFEPDIDPAHAPLSPIMRHVESTLNAADGVFIAVPEYNHSLPGRLKNALDMISRIVSQPMQDMPVMIVSASIGRLGGARAQYELRRILDSMGAVSLIQPEVFIGDASSKFNKSGDCTDALTLGFMRKQIEAFGHLMASVRVDKRRQPSLEA